MNSPHGGASFARAVPTAVLAVDGEHVYVGESDGTPSKIFHRIVRYDLAVIKSGLDPLL